MCQVRTRQLAADGHCFTVHNITYAGRVALFSYPYVFSFVVGFDMVALSSILVSVRKHFLLTKELEQLVLASAIGEHYTSTIFKVTIHEYLTSQMYGLRQYISKSYGYVATYHCLYKCGISHQLNGWKIQSRAFLTSKNKNINDKHTTTNA